MKQEIVDSFNQDNHDMVCPMCEESYMIHKENKGTHIYYCENCPFVGVEIIELKDYENMIEWLNDSK